MGHRQSGDRCHFSFHSPVRDKGPCMKSGAVPTVYIVDDDRGVRQAIQDLVESVGLRAESFATGQEFLNRKRSADPSCLVLDVRLPQMSGLDFQSKLADLGLPIPIIFITAHGDIPMSVRALKSGAVEFLTKPFRDQDLLDAIQQALQRDRAAREQQDEVSELHQRYLALTARERLVMDLVVTGMLNKQIGSEIGASESTVKIHRGNVMQKMQAGSLVELVRMADKLKPFLPQ
jgi:FixJ family two-component response regulator